MAALNKTQLQVFARVSAAYDCAGLDADACLFIQNAGITDTTEKTAINDLVLDLKAASIYTKMQALYPFVGGTANKHKYNLIDPRDLDVAYRLAYSGAWTHTADGATPTTTIHADTFFIPSSVQNVNSNGITFALNTTSANNLYNMGSRTGASQQSTMLSRNALAGGFLNSAQNTHNPADGTAMGVVTLSKQSATVTVLYKNATKLKTVNSGGTLPDVSIFLNGYNIAGSGTSRDDKRFCFAAIHEGLSDAECASFHGIIDDFSTALSRKTW